MSDLPTVYTCLRCGITKKLHTARTATGLCIDCKQVLADVELIRRFDRLVDTGRIHIGPDARRLLDDNDLHPVYVARSHARHLYTGDGELTRVDVEDYLLAHPFARQADTRPAQMEGTAA